MTVFNPGDRVLVRPHNPANEALWGAEVEVVACLETGIASIRDGARMVAINTDELQPAQNEAQVQTHLEVASPTLQPILKRLTVQIADIRIDGETQVRVAGIQQDTVERYETLWRGYGDDCPLAPVKLMRDSDGTLWLFDGYHTREAAIRAERQTVFADVYEGTLADAQWEACFVQSQRGLSLSREDYRNVMIQALKLNQARAVPLSLRSLARQLGVAHNTLTYQFNKLAQSGQVKETPETIAQKGDDCYRFETPQHTFGQLVELYKPIGNFVKSPGRLPYELELPGKSLYFRSLDDAYDQYFAIAEKYNNAPISEPEPDLFSYREPEPAPAPVQIGTTPTSHPAGVIGSARSCERYTPEFIWQAGLNTFGVDEFDLDPATFTESPIPCRRIFTKAENGLIQPWVAETLWSNFPYSDRDEDDKLQQVMGLWVAKLIESYQCGDVKQALTLVKSDCRTEWFHQLLEVSTAFCCIRKAIRHGIPEGDTAKNTASFFGSIVFYLGDNLDSFHAGFSPIGTICQSLILP